MAQAHEFLRNYCLSNPQNQALLHKHLDLFLTPGVSKFMDMCLLRLFSRGEKTFSRKYSTANTLKTLLKSDVRFDALGILCH